LRCLEHRVQAGENCPLSVAVFVAFLLVDVGKGGWGWVQSRSGGSLVGCALSKFVGTEEVVIDLPWGDGYSAF